MRLILGLGNPGREYTRSRHNVGYRVADCLSARWKCPLSSSEALCWLGRTVVAEGEVLLAKPQTFMNSSGRAARMLSELFGLVPEEFLVVCDDIDLPLGQIRLRPSGGDGGHKGLLSVSEALGAQTFPRLRVGVGRPPEGVDAADWVLGAFEPAEEQVAEGVVPRAADAVDVVLRCSLAEAMSQFNGRFFDRDGSLQSGPGGC